MKVTSTGSVFYCDAPASMKELKADGWNFLPAGRKWITSSKLAAFKYVEHADDATSEKLRKWAAEKREVILPSISADSNISVPAPSGLEYRPYQKAGIAYMLARRTSLNADVPRLGKTIQTLGVANHYGRILNILVVCPSIAKINWVNEARKWLVHKHRSGYCSGDFTPEAEFVSCNYDILDRNLEALSKTKWDIVVFDEAHYLKNPTAKRTAAALKLSGTLHTIFLTGTPAFTRPKDLFTLVKSCDPYGLGSDSFWFMKRYCGAKKDDFGRWDYDGSSNEAELQYKMRASFMVRREKSDVMTEIPPTRNTFYLSKDGIDHLIQAELNEVQANFRDLLKSLSEGNSDVLERLAEWDGRNPESVIPLVTLRKQLAIAKVPKVVAFCQDLMQTEDKIVVFAHHREATVSLAEKLGFECIVGGLTDTKRHERIQRFKNDPECRGIVGNITAMGTAVSLMESDVAVFSELSWIPSEIDQAEERIWDPTKDTACSIYKLVLEDSLEAKISYALEQRQENISRLMNRRFLGLG